jgi:cysteinyl-tRNA synthetase
MHAFYRFFDRFQRITGESYFTVPVFDKSSPPLAVGVPQELVELRAQRDRFLEAMEDDFNTGGGIGILYDMLRLLNGIGDRAELASSAAPDRALLHALREGVAILRELSSILGVFSATVADSSKRQDDLTSRLIELLIDLRKQARVQKNFSLADDVRNRLKEIGVALEDRPGGTTWRIE